MHNYVFFKNDKEVDKPIFRVFSIERLLETYTKKALVLVKPKKWDDPFENFILKSKAKLQTGEQVDFAFADSIFGQCWSQLQESDAMWRIYSPSKNGVKVRTTPRKLREALASQVATPELTAFIGKVQYKRRSELTSMVQDRVRMQQKIFDDTGRGHAETLLFKRKEFLHEHEVRLIYSGNIVDAEKDFFTFAIDPPAIFEEIIFDPRMDFSLASVYEQHFRTSGYTGKIMKSQLYELPELTISV